MQHQRKRKHHYIPKFHLNMWKDETGKLLIYQKDGSSKINPKMKHPSQVCFRNDLYTLKKDPFGSAIQVPDYIEEELAKIDNNAAKVIKKIQKNYSLAGLTSKDKQDWATYVNSLLQRSPKRLEALEGMMQSIIREVFDDIKTVYETQNAWEICRKIFNDSNYCENEVRAMLLSVIRDNKWITGLLNFQWQLITLNDHFPYKFILTECPVITIDDGDNISIIALALTPNLLWIALPCSFDGSQDLNDFIKNIIMIYNAKQMATKPNFIISKVLLTNDGFHNYDKIFKDFLRSTVGVEQLHSQAVRG
ncbi:MAG: hypothetical protein A4E72_02135 [Syntrophus sp. PtaU1.Bin208]|nr:MAG: hypothetical protein A4E72_02135 [Syntrophus sp. PtaU1.Bin208]